MKKDNWKKYGFSFWVSFSIIAIALGLLGAAFAGFSAYTIVLGQGGIFWTGLFVFGLISLACAIFCFKLLPDWANMIRTFRLLDQRFKGAMGATSVSQYLQADEERNRVFMESFEAKQNAIGHNLAERMDKLKSENEANSRQTNANIEQMTKTMKSFMSMMERFTSPLAIQQHREEAEKLMEEANKATSWQSEKKGIVENSDGNREESFMEKGNDTEEAFYEDFEDDGSLIEDLDEKREAPPAQTSSGEENFF